MQQKVNRTASFNLSWAEFKAGFGRNDSNYWLGNDEIHRLTKDGGYKLRIDLQQKYTDKWFWVEYDKFIVGDEASNYIMTLGEFSGNTADALTSYNNGGMFATYDRDNDVWVTGKQSNSSCAILTRGGFWFRGCGIGFPNGGLGSFHWLGLPGAQQYLKTCRMSLICV